MAKRLEDEYPGSTVPGNADYPNGSFLNSASTGTPFETGWANDWLGFFDALLRNGEVTPNGNEDVVFSAQRVQALQKIVGKKRAYINTIDAAASPNYQIDLIMITNVNDRLYERITIGETRSDTFTDTEGQKWGSVTFDDWYRQIRVLWNRELIANLPASDTLEPTERSYVTTNATTNLVDLPASDILQASTRSLITTRATTELENLPLSDTLDGSRRYLSTDSGDDIEGLLGVGGTVTTTVLGAISVPFTYPASGRVLIEGRLQGRLRDTGGGGSETITINIGAGASTTVWGRTGGASGISITLDAYAVRILTGTPGTSDTVTTASASSTTLVAGSTRHTTTVIPV